MTKYRLIKKYKNRRLYDLETSKFITVDELHQYVVEGLLFQVLDAATGNDITNATLLQIFVDIDGNNTKFLSSTMLRQLIVMAHHPMNLSFKAMLENMMQAMDNQFLQNICPDDYQKATEACNQQALTFLSQWQNSISKMTGFK